jgi:uncharacterized protein involved in tolerance to divalent cations
VNTAACVVFLAATSAFVWVGDVLELKRKEHRDEDLVDHAVLERSIRRHKGD